MQTHVQVKRMSDGSCGVWALECRRYRQKLLGDGKVTECSTAHVQVKRMPDGSSCDTAVFIIFLLFLLFFSIFSISI